MTPAADANAQRGLIGHAAAASAPLALAVTALLFVQWPLRDVVGAYATEANDLAQWLFALYVAVAVVHAQQRGAHLVARPDLAARGGRWQRAGGALCVLPWAVYLVVSSAPTVLRSVRSLERFPETTNPGYFMIRVALLLLGLLLALQAAAALWAALRARR